MKFYVKEKLGLTQSLTPEGFLLCEEVPINRIGTMLYAPGETPIPAGPDGIVRIERDAEEVFRPETLASAQGKPIVDQHPAEAVDPDNWNRLAVGVVLNPRRGTGIRDDMAIADFLITNRGAIREVQDGKREVSCGYDADYDELGPGRGRQKNIVINHVALVDSGRCGPRCAIGDSKEGVKRMTIRERIRNAFKSKDEGALTAVLDELPQDQLDKENSKTETHVHVHVRDKEDEDKDEEEKEEKDHKTTDALDARLKKVEDNQDAMRDTLDKVAKDVADIK